MKNFKEFMVILWFGVAITSVAGLIAGIVVGDVDVIRLSSASLLVSVPTVLALNYGEEV